MIPGIVRSMENDAKQTKRGSRVLRFAVSGALLVAPLGVAACGGGNHAHPNEPAHVDEPASDTTQTGQPEEEIPEDEHVNVGPDENAGE